MAKLEEDRSVQEIRTRYFEALKAGHSKEEAAAIAQKGSSPKATPKAVADKPVEKPAEPEEFEDSYYDDPEPDDLTEIRGVGSGTVKKLKDLGVTSFEQVAAWTHNDVTRFDNALGLRGRIAREGWVEQAKELVGKP
jgi:large subunit ribosomal protein L21